jgi:RNA 2',3'-cyclic 3'-phosphodiesterase
MEVIRAFIAVDLSPEVERSLEQVLGQLQQSLRGGAVRWVPSKNIHLTLKFLGDVSVKNLDLLKDILSSEAVKYSPFEISAAELGAFPSIQRARVIWVGVKAPPTLAQLQHEIDVETAHLGYPPDERKFSPHLTLGRVARNASPEDSRRIGEALSGTRIGSLGTARIEAVHLYRSDLNPQGSVYTRLYSALLKTSEPT